MCRSIEDGGRRCRCTTPEAAAEERRKRNEAQKRYLKRKAAASVVEVETVTEPEVTEPDAETPDYDADAAHTEALQRLHAAVTASKVMEDQAHAESVEAAAAAVADAPNPFEGIAIPEPETTVSIDEAFAAHMARAAAEELAYREQEARDTSPRRAQVEANFFAFMDELRTP